MKKKLVSLVLTAAMMGSVLAGCGGSSSADNTTAAGDAGTAQTEPSAAVESADASEAAGADQGTEDLSGTLSILSWYDETKAAPVIEAFNAKYPNVTIDFQYSPPVADYVEKLSTLLYSGAGPDIFYMALENREDLIKGNYVEDLSNEPYMTDGTIPESVKTT